VPSESERVACARRCKHTVPCAPVGCIVHLVVRSRYICLPPINPSAPTLETLADDSNFGASSSRARTPLPPRVPCPYDRRAHLSQTTWLDTLSFLTRSRHVCTASARLPGALDESTSSTAAVYTCAQAVVDGGGDGGRAAHRTLHALASVEEHRAGAHGRAGKDMAAQ
jgi:hypothetical protein